MEYALKTSWKAHIEVHYICSSIQDLTFIKRLFMGKLCFPFIVFKNFLKILLTHTFNNMLQEIFQNSQCMALNILQMHYYVNVYIVSLNNF